MKIKYPPKRMRPNENLADDREYRESALDQLKNIEEHHIINNTTAILDLGCGLGRIATGLLIKYSHQGLWGSPEYYCGIDINKKKIRWCNKWISKHNRGYEFIYHNAHNGRYNQAGKLRPALPIGGGGKFDIVIISSVFTHMIDEDIKHYLSEISRVIKTTGIAYITAFIESDVESMTINPAGYLGRESSGPLHRVVYDLGYFMGLIRSAGFIVIEYKYQGIPRTKQTVIIIKKALGP